MEPTHIVIRGAEQHNLKKIDVAIPRSRLVVITGVSGSGKSSLAFDTIYAEGQRRYVESLSAYARQFLGQMDKPKADYIGGLSPAIAIEQKAGIKNPRSTVGTVTEVLDYLRVLYARVGVPHCLGCGRPVQAQSAQQIAAQLAALPEGTRFQLLAPLVRRRKGTHADVIEQARKDGYVRARIDGVLVELAGPIKLAKTQQHTIELVVDRLQIPCRGGSGTAPGPDMAPDGPRRGGSGSAPGSGTTYPENGSFTTENTENAEVTLSSVPSVTSVVKDPVLTSGRELDAHDYSAPWESFLARLADSVETTLAAGHGLLIADLGERGELTLSEQHACPHCGISFPELSPQLFSFNSPLGMCPECNGLGTQLVVDPALIVQNPALSLMDGALRWYGPLRKKQGGWTHNQVQAIAAHFGVSLDTPWQDLPEAFRHALLYGSEEKIHFSYQAQSPDASWSGESVSTIKGIIYNINRLFHQTHSDYTRRWYLSFMSALPCPACGGARLRPEARAVTVGGKSIVEVSAMSIDAAQAWAGSLGDTLTPDEMQIAGEVLKEIRARLQFMLNVGLHYLTLDRPAPSLSGGEGQRIRLASQIGCGLVGVLYILDEPSIGLHARDNQSLLTTLKALRDLGNTVLVVEHDAETIRAADWLLDLGPGPGILGGELVVEGTPADVAADPRSLTGRYLSGELAVTAPNGTHRRCPNGHWLSVVGASLHNLQSVTVRFPLGLLTCVTGVSGSGKSSLVAETLHPALARALHDATATPGPHERIEGLELVDKVIDITQDPIGRTPRSNPATYVGLFDDIRRVFALTPEARARGYKGNRFSFNVKGGRCEACKGHGQKRIEMHFLADVWVPCRECHGTRYNRETLAIRYKGKSIADVLAMDVQEALAFFANHPALARTLQTLHDVGLDYIKLGQSATTLSGGEAQRVKLAKELSRAATGRTVYILDEPTTGLHFADIQRLLDVLHRLVDAGNTVIVIEHNLDVIKTADWVIDLGPEGGAAGGQVVAQGTPEQVAQVDASHTGRFLRAELRRNA
ncbi:MAG TPA: excinuclease ABC subunit UvrA [Anaerolineae bacterium]|nr:excinuclease ABC subunit UvrA [Anaerolineae bacterium]